MKKKKKSHFLRFFALESTRRCSHKSTRWPKHTTQEMALKSYPPPTGHMGGWPDVTPNHRTSPVGGGRKNRILQFSFFCWPVPCRNTKDAHISYVRERDREGVCDGPAVRSTHATPALRGQARSATVFAAFPAICAAVASKLQCEGREILIERGWV